MDFRKRVNIIITLSHHPGNNSLGHSQLASHGSTVLFAKPFPLKPISKYIDITYERNEPARSTEFIIVISKK